MPWQLEEAAEDNACVENEETPPPEEVSCGVVWRHTERGTVNPPRAYPIGDDKESMPESFVPNVVAGRADIAYILCKEYSYHYKNREEEEVFEDFERD